MKFIDKLMRRLGYISKDKHDADIRILNVSHRAETERVLRALEQERTVNINKILEAINGTSFVQAKIATPRFNVVSSDLQSPETVSVETIYPPTPEYATLSAKVDIAGMSHINDKLSQMELEYFLHNFMRELESRISVAMSMTGLY